MDKNDEILLALGRIEGRIIGIEKLADRVGKLETWMAWLKGGWAMLLAALAWLCRNASS